MTTPITHTTPGIEQAEQEKRPRDFDNWANLPSPVFKVAQTPAGALNLLDGKQVTGPLRGFGPIWQKRYWIELPGSLVTPHDVIRIWKANFPKFWPKGNTFYTPITGIKPGEVALINSQIPGGITFSTGVMVLYADEDQFTFITPEGHIFAGWITFSSYERDGKTVVQVDALVRSPDPLMEVALRFGGYRQEDRFWEITLGKLSRYFGVQAPFHMRRECVDPRMQWSGLRYMRYDALIRTVGYLLMAPARFAARRMGSYGQPTMRSR